MSAALHEILGVAVAAIVAVTIVSILSPKATTNAVAQTTFSGFNSMLGQISSPVK